MIQGCSQQCLNGRRWAFSIWGIIFALEGVGVIYQLLPKGYGQEGKKRIVNSVGEHPLQACRSILHHQ